MKDCTELVFILDRSGSMHGLEADTIGGFNSLLDKQRAEGCAVLVSTVMFNEESKVIHDRCDIGTVRPLTEADYEPSGTTALIDAIGSAVKHIRNVHRYARTEDVPARTLFVITTDGMENASHHFTVGEVRTLIEEQKKAGWEFLFLGANIDAVETARGFGISEDRAVDFVADGMGMKENFRALEKACLQFECRRPLSDDWKKDIADDHKKRSGKKRR